MKTGPLAVIDLGSNTFHLLICALDENGSFVQVYKDRVYVKLASAGLGFIDEESERRGLEAMQHFATQLKEYNVSRVKAVGTSALREASNGTAVTARYTRETGIAIDIIDGYTEADYILGGTMAAIPSLDRPGLIMDIGGGSVEFILFSGDEVRFKGSYKTGVSVLFRRFHQSDPISEDKLEEMDRFLDGELCDLLSALSEIKAYYLIGSSGSFEVIQDLLPHVSTSDNWSELDLKILPRELHRIVHTTLAERKAIPEIPPERLDYIVVAFALIRYITSRNPPTKLFYCDFALKEGVLAELASNS